MTSRDRLDRSPEIAELLDDAFVSPLDVETAARHLWAIHREAARLEQETVGQPVPVDDHDITMGRRRMPKALAPLLAMIMMMSMSGVAVAASQQSLPGDVLYGVKRGSESAQLVLTRDPHARARLQLSFAETRLDEIVRIATTRPEAVIGLVEDLTVRLSEAEQSGPAIAPDTRRLREQTNVQIAQLRLPREITDAVDEVLGSGQLVAASERPGREGPATAPPAGTAAAADDDQPSRVAPPAPVSTTPPPATSDATSPPTDETSDTSGDSATSGAGATTGPGQGTTPEDQTPQGSDDNATVAPDVIQAPDALSATVGESASPEPGDGTPSATPTPDPLLDPNGSPSPSPQPSASPSPSPSPSPTPSPTTSPRPPITPGGSGDGLQSAEPVQLGPPLVPFVRQQFETDATASPAA